MKLSTSQMTFTCSNTTLDRNDQTVDSCVQLQLQLPRFPFLFRVTLIPVTLIFIAEIGRQISMTISGSGGSGLFLRACLECAPQTVVGWEGSPATILPPVLLRFSYLQLLPLQVPYELNISA